ncbi:sensor histidine kinase [Buttiauxella sp. B2]|uniref:tetrathionate respiration histidine kinase TtrS n=1 Tax=Buttiauxella sp. B2 TaxID=2587812 RepID=UPI0011243315|nr:tetrathionate respiration histidine kinase TtrS [Buttiauxella sp. B2]TNV16833.1 sensor histidine kinase [Buttiauxella sp. B2]
MSKIILLVLCLLLSQGVQAAEWAIGVLAMRGDSVTIKQWQSLIDTLNGSVPGAHFRLVPLNLDGMRAAVNKEDIQFVLTNPAQFVQLNSHYHLRWLASLRSTQSAGSTNNTTGSAILVRTDSKITTPHDLIGATVGAVDPNAFGGYLLGYKALRDSGLRPEKDFQVRFTGFPADALLYLLREDVIQAAIVPVCLLENMDSEGLVSKSAFRALLQKPSQLPCLTSTALYPDWSFAALPGVKDDVADAVARALMNSTDDKSWHWGAPASTNEVEALLRDLNQHPEQQWLGLSIKSWVVQHQFMLGLLLVVLLLAVANYIWVMILVNRRGRALEKANETLRAQQLALEQARRMSILGEMASGFAHELNQPLSAIRLYAQGCLVRLSQTKEQESLREAMNNIDLQAQRGGNIISNLRNWATSGRWSDKTTSTWSTINVISTLERVVVMLHLPQQHSELALNITGDKTLTLTLPPVLLEQVLANLISNAVQAGATTLWIDIAGDSEQVNICLQDNAGGIPADQLESVFQPFRSSRADGMGLGLVVCQRLLRSVNGDIQLINRNAPDMQAGLLVKMTFPA